MKSWHALNIEETKAALDALPKAAGPNQIEDRDTVRWHTMLLRQFKSLLILILAVAAVLSFVVGDKVDALAILAVIILNGLLGFAQEWKAETALKNLKKMLSPRCRVVRDGREIEIDAERLVSGDRVILSSGRAVPADIRLTAAVDLKTDESALTGESLPLDKDTKPLPEETPLAEKRNMAWMGTHVVNGHGEGLVVATGMQTEFGRIAGLTGKITETGTQLQKQLAKLARQLGGLALLAALAVVTIGIIHGKNTTEVLMTGISLAVAAVPEGLPAVVTITLALGAGMMARKKALLRNLQAAETLGAVSVICTDKTGTLTKNEMTVQKIWLPTGDGIDVSGAGYAPEGAFSLRGAVFEAPLNPDLMEFLDTGRKCSTARIEKTERGWRAIGSPTEAALVVAAEKAGLKQDHHSVIVAEFSFNSTRKRMSVVEDLGNGRLLSHVKGAPETILSLCSAARIGGQDRPMTDELRRQAVAACEALAAQGLRTLALARKDMAAGSALTETTAESHLTLLGIAGVIDPPRPEVPAALEKAKSAGIKVIVITGDSGATAKAIAGQIGLKTDKILTSAEMKALTDAELAAILQDDVLFARTVPEDKFRIVKLLQDQNRLVAMTGDGVNDAPALKQADIGIAMGIRGTDVAKGAADIVLTDDNFASIIAAIEEGRRQYANIRKFVRYLTSANIGETLTIFANIVTGGPLVLLPIQILWINLVTDGVTALSLSVERAEKNIMQELPRAMDQPILARDAILSLGLFGSYIAAATLWLFYTHADSSYPHINTIAFTAVVALSNAHVLNFRNLHGPIAAIGWFSNPWLLAAIAAMMGLQVLAVHLPFLQTVLHTVPLAPRDWALIAGITLPLFVVPELYKIARGKSS